MDRRAAIGSRSAQRRYSEDVLDNRYPSAVVTKRGLSTTTKVILALLLLCGLGVVAYGIYIAVAKREKLEDDETARARSAEELKKIREDEIAQKRVQYEAKRIADAAERARMAKIIFGTDGLLPTETTVNGQNQFLVNDFDISQLQIAAAGNGLSSGDTGTIPGDVISRMISQSIAYALCPRQMYEIWSNALDVTWACLQRCPVGYESITYAPRDEAGNPLKIHPIDPVTGKEDLTKLEQVPATPWCRAICPILLASPNRQEPVSHSEHMKPDAKPVEYNKMIKRTDDADPAYCTRQKERRSLMRGGNNIVCGWCEKDLQVPDGLNGTSVNRHHCETSDRHYGLDFTNWCQRRRMIPNFRIEKIDDKNDGTLNNLETAICAAIGGSLGAAKRMQWIEGPKACRGGGELLPINSSGYFDGNGNAIGMVAPTNLFYGTTMYKIPEDKVIARFADKEKNKDEQRDYSLMHYACYTPCPPHMTPVGPVENHLCAESCPPNTSSLLTFSDDIRCKKMTFQQPPVIDDFMMVVSEMTKAYILKMQQDQKK